MAAFSMHVGMGFFNLNVDFIVGFSFIPSISTLDSRWPRRLE